MAVHLDGPIDQGSFGDLDFDRDVDLDDFAVFKNVFPGGSAGLQAALAAANVPEPASVLLIVIAASGLVFTRRRIAD
jgi:hypothetical protein